MNYKEKQISFLKKEISYKRIEEQIQSKTVQSKIKTLQTQIEREICSTIPSAFWNRKQHIVNLPYVKNFEEKNIPSKARPIQMNKELLTFCRAEINDLLQKGLIRPSKSPWSCAAFYVNNQVEKERGVPRLVINYIPLNKVLEWIRLDIQFQINQI